MFHILLGLASVTLGALALIKLNSKLLNIQAGAFVGTVATGISLVVINPAALMHLCVTGTVFSAVTIALMVMTRRQLAFARQSN